MKKYVIELEIKEDVSSNNIGAYVPADLAEEMLEVLKATYGYVSNWHHESLRVYTTHDEVLEKLQSIINKAEA